MVRYFSSYHICWSFRVRWSSSSPIVSCLRPFSSWKLCLVWSWRMAASAGQTLNDRLLAARHSIAGQGLAKAVCKATTEELIGPKKKHLDCNRYQKKVVSGMASITFDLFQICYTALKSPMCRFQPWPICWLNVLKIRTGSSCSSHCSPCTTWCVMETSGSSNIWHLVTPTSNWAIS